MEVVDDVVDLRDEYRSLLSVCSLRLAANQDTTDVNTLIVEYDDMINAYNEAVFLSLELGGIDHVACSIKTDLINFKVRVDEAVADLKCKIKGDYLKRGVDEQLIDSTLSYVIDI